MSGDSTLDTSRGCKRLLYVISDHRFFKTHRLPLAIAARKAGYQVAVAGPPSDEPEVYRDLGLQYLTVPLCRRGGSLMSEGRTILGIRSAIRDFNPHLAHLIAAKPVIYGGVLCRIAGVPTVSAITGLGYAFIRDGARGALLRQALLLGYRCALNRRSSHIIFQNRDDLALFRRCGVITRATWSVLNGSGADLVGITPKPLPDGTTVLVLPARMIHDKGIHEFVAAARLIRERGVQARFQLLGDPDEGNPMSIKRADLVAWTKEGVIEWLPYTPDIANALGRSHIVVLPSYREGFPKALIDAAAAGRAAAASDVAGCRDAILPGKTGLLFRPRDPEHMAETLIPLIQSRDRQMEMGAAARLHALALFNINDICDSHIRLHDSLSGHPLLKCR